ncbi:hypothetical protein ACH5RR_031617 [Cinchona calisaya]|uniref:Uncharacterized protein n=1 Tax=Cinchona calisaya TaxID=153742 RepID=A0ABD2YJ77_9GENT
MLLRTSSTPVGQTLYSDIPNRHIKKNSTNSSTSKINLHGLDHLTTKASFTLSSISSNSSPANLSRLSESNTKSRRKIFHRAQSDTSLEGLASNSHDLEEL